MNSLIDVIRRAEQNGVAVGHFNISELAALRAITHAAADLRVPVIIGTSEGEAEFIGMNFLIREQTFYSSEASISNFIKTYFLTLPSKLKKITAICLLSLR